VCHPGASQRAGTSNRLRRRIPACLLPFAVCLSFCGCASFWDDVTSRDFTVSGLFSPPNPFLVLRDSQDGDKRARALRALHEPKPNGGTQQDQEAVVKILTTAASSEKQPLCRLAAIQALSSFKDPRAVEGLTQAFYNAGAFPPDTATIIRCQALTALGRTKNSAAVELLARVVHEPPAEGTDLERQQTVDIRIAAARALGNFNRPQASEALLQVLRTEKDVALRDRAAESLQVCTGKNHPADAKAWEQELHPQPQSKDLTADQPKKSKILGWF
jgi:HEAT repeats